MKYLIIGLMGIAILMLAFYFLAMITKNKRFYGAFRLSMILLELLFFATWIYSLVVGINFHMLWIFIIVFALLLYYS